MRDQGEISQRSVRDQSEIRGDQPENSELRERKLEISGDQGEINGDEGEVSERSGNDQSEISGDQPEISGDQ